MRLLSSLRTAFLAATAALLSAGAQAGPMPTNVAAIKSMVDQNTTEVRWRGGGYGYRGVGYRGGGYGYRGVGYRGGGYGYRGVGYRGGGSGYRGVGYRGGGSPIAARGYRGGLGYRGYGYRGLGYGAVAGGAIARRRLLWRLLWRQWRLWRLWRRSLLQLTPAVPYGYGGGYGYRSGAIARPMTITAGEIRRRFFSPPLEEGGRRKAARPVVEGDAIRPRSGRGVLWLLRPSVRRRTCGLLPAPSRSQSAAAGATAARRPSGPWRNAQHARSITTHSGRRGTSPNFLITSASLKTPVAGSPVRLNATAPTLTLLAR
jgi:hypothetical protein